MQFEFPKNEMWGWDQKTIYVTLFSCEKFAIIQPGFRPKTKMTKNQSTKTRSALVSLTSQSFKLQNISF